MGGLQGEKLGVIAVAGKYRTGKSTLSNILLDDADVFKVGHSIVGCTKGIWIATEPLKDKQANGAPINMYLVDSEGLLDTDKD